ncbi:hypothetical protein BDZ45DRAFT_313295 [Acephala macrosclerotiorum]|nr:hypothetical protein BDZ45DRAFT_313295 [Acephala macrosclerotiorum]
MSSRTGYAVVVVLTLLISYAVTSIRFYLRSRLKKKFHWNLPDTIIVISLILQTGLSGIGLTAIYLPLSENSEIILKLFHFGSLVYLGTLWSIKLSISIFLLRLTHRLDQANRFALFCLYVICATFVGAVLAELCQCIPMPTLWQGTCDRVKIKAAFWAKIALNLGTDIMLICVPFPALLLITERRIRIAVSIVFGLAGIMVVVSIIRAILIANDDIKLNNLIIILSHIEVMSGVIISALPEVSRGFTRAYLQSSSIRSFETGTTSHRQRTQQTTNGATLSTTDSKKDGLVSQRAERSRDGIDDIEAESTDEQYDSSTSRALEDSIDRISPYPSQGSSFPNTTEGKKEIVETITFEMKVL